MLDFNGIPLCLQVNLPSFATNKFLFGKHSMKDEVALVSLLCVRTISITNVTFDIIICANNFVQTPLIFIIFIDWANENECFSSINHIYSPGENLPAHEQW